MLVQSLAHNPRLAYPMRLGIVDKQHREPPPARRSLHTGVQGSTELVRATALIRPPEESPLGQIDGRRNGALLVRPRRLDLELFPPHHPGARQRRQQAEERTSELQSQ